MVTASMEIGGRCAGESDTGTRLRAEPSTATPDGRTSAPSGTMNVTPAKAEMHEKDSSWAVVSAWRRSIRQRPKSVRVRVEAGTRHRPLRLASADDGEDPCIVVHPHTRVPSAGGASM